MNDATTLLEAVRMTLANAARYNPGDVVAPAAVLWTDADGQWRPLVEQLRGLMPEVLTLGEYDPQTRTGPAIWLRCVIEPAVRADKFPDLAWPGGTVPVIYMPEVSRQTLRAVEECPDKLKPLVELQYRGTVWTQKNGKDWTIRAFLVSDDGGLGLDVAEDKLTLQAMQGALSQLAVTSAARLRGKRLEAEDFDKLMIADTPRDLLLWLGDPQATLAQRDEGKWAAFRNRCRQDYGFDPETDGEIVGGEKLGQRGEAQGTVALREGLLAGRKRLDGRLAPEVTRAGWHDERRGRAAASGSIGGRARPASRVGLGAARHVPTCKRFNAPSGVGQADGDLAGR